VTAAFLPGRIHGVLGENGAGKSTLMRVAAGLLASDDGRIVSGAVAAGSWGPRDAAAAGVAMVHQHFMLVPSLTVVENCLLGRRDLGQWRARRLAAAMVAETCRRVGLPVEPNARVETLSVGEQQRVEIVRALSVARRVLILDEPTAVLTPGEIEPLFAALKQLRDGGLAIVFISHKLGEVMRLCDDVTILRRGRRVHTGPANALTREDMARLMVGEAPDELPIRRMRHHQPPSALELHALCASSMDQARAIHDIGLTVHAGEIVGVAGVEGNGQDVLAAVIVGMAPAQQGRVLLGGTDVTRLSVRERAARGLAHIPEDRLRQGLIPGMDLTENLSLRSYRLPPLSAAGAIRWSRARARAAGLVKEYDVRGPSIATPVERLSGGNQQKLLLARELAGSPRVILAQNPVRGLDIAATRFVFAQLLAQRERGAGILLIHSDLDELLAVADRVVVLYGGRLFETGWPGVDRETIGRLMLGGVA
jgi:simple sugar transport system ATP-binding protein